MKSVYDVIMELRSNNSRLFKEKVVNENKDNENLRLTFLYTLDGSKQYYIKKIPDYKPSNYPTLQFEFIFTVLDNLNNRVFTGNAAIEYVRAALMNLQPQDAKVLEMIIKRDLDCGVSISTVEKTWEKLIPQTPYMRCSGYKNLLKIQNKIDWERGVYSQMKSDGMFTSVTFHQRDLVTFSTRKGNLLSPSHFTGIIEKLNKFSPDNRQYHGEMLVIEDGELLPRHTGNGILGSVLKGGSFGLNQEPVFVCWDVIPADQSVTDGTYTKPYHQRFEEIVSLFGCSGSVSASENKILHSMEEVIDHYTEMLERGEEGTIIKLPDAIWVDGDSKEQFKIKLEFSCDLKAVSLNPGDGKNAATFGSIYCESSEGLLSVSISGMPDDARKYIFENWNDVKGGVVEVVSNSITYPKKAGGKHSLFLPRFKKIRADKSTVDSLERIIDQYDSLVGKKK